MGLLRDLMAARDLVTEVTRGLDDMSRAMGQVTQAVQTPLGPGGGTFDSPPGEPPGQGSPLGAPGGLQPFAQAGTILLGPDGQVVATSGWGNAPRRSSRGGGGGGGGGGSRRNEFTGFGMGGGSTPGAPWGGATISTSGGGGGGNTLVNGMTPGTLATTMKGSVAEPVVTSLQEIRDELRAMRQEQRNATGLRAAGIA